jgi:recombination protein RecA
MVEKSQTKDEKLVEMAIANIEKQYGKGSVMRFGDKVAIDQGVKTTSTGSITLDKALGIGGLPRGRLIEIFGPEMSGKTTLALHCVANSQKAGGICAFIDAEHALDPIYATAIGVDMDNLLLSQPDYGEQALDIADEFAKTGGVQILVIDSVAALVPKTELEGDMGDIHVGLQARLMSQALRKITANVHKSGTMVVFINQTRSKIGVQYGNPTTTTGGNALKFYASVRLDIARIGAIKEGENVIGNRTRVKVVKNKLAPPFKQVEFDIIYGKGINVEAEVIDLAIENDIIKKSGAWFSYEGANIGQGKENTKQYLEENPQILAQIKKELDKCT